MTFPESHVSQADFAPLAGGWYRASCRFMVPDGIMLVRWFGLRDVKGLWQDNDAPAPDGEWTALEVRKHHVRLISDSVTREDYRDQLELPALVHAGDDAAALERVLAHQFGVTSRRTRRALSLRRRSRYVTAWFRAHSWPWRPPRRPRETGGKGAAPRAGSSSCRGLRQARTGPRTSRSPTWACDQ